MDMATEESVVTNDLRFYSLIFNQENQEPAIENGKILLWNNRDNACEYVSLTPNLKEHFTLVETETQKIITENVEKPSEELCSDFPNTEDPGKFTWTHQSTLLMLDEYKSRFSRFRNPKIKKKTLWEEIADVMKKRGYIVDTDCLDRKMRNMKNTYRTICDNNNKKKSTGRGRVQWEYYNYFVDMFLEDKTVNLPRSILSTTKIDSETTAELFVDTSCSSNSKNLSTPLSSPSFSTVEQLSVSENTPTSSSKKLAEISRLDRFRKRQIEVEEEKLKELKKIRKSIEESNRLQKEKIELLKQCFLPKATE